MRLIGTGIIEQAQDKVRIDLNSARYIYLQETERIKDIVRLTSLRNLISEAVAAKDFISLQQELDRIRKREILDVLTLTDSKGRVIVRTRNPATIGDTQSEGELVRWVIANNEVAAETTIVSREELSTEGSNLAAQARLELIPTPKAKPRDQKEETSGMMIKAAAPIMGSDGSLLGILYGGHLLNRDYAIVDRIKDIVYQGIKYKGKDIGTATIFQGDLRISTNVKRIDGSRAIGTRVSREVNDQVLVKGLPWIDRAFVVNNWYISAYEPIKNIHGEIIGILYVGLLEEKFVDMRKKTTMIFLGITLAGMIIAFIISYFLSRQVVKPIDRLVKASGQLEQGNLEYQLNVDTKGEIGKLMERFNRMAIALKERDEQLQEHTQRQIMKSEKLATLGQLAAGVAHEINNPLGGVLMYIHLALEDLGDTETLGSNLEKAAREVTRCKDIVKGLLDFARQTEPKFEVANVNDVLDRTLALLQNQALFQNVTVTRETTGDIPDIELDISQIQQVFTNIIFNAAEAMNGQGTLTISTRKLTRDTCHESTGESHESCTGCCIEMTITDTGSGISGEHMKKIFDPFFTTKEVGGGTGLGLAVTYGIISRHKGTVTVDSEEGKGTSFTIRLPCKRSEN